MTNLRFAAAAKMLLTELHWSCHLMHYGMRVNPRAWCIFWNACALAVVPRSKQEQDQPHPHLAKTLTVSGLNIRLRHLGQGGACLCIFLRPHGTNQRATVTSGGKGVLFSIATA